MVSACRIAPTESFPWDSVAEIAHHLPPRSVYRTEESAWCRGWPTLGPAAVVLLQLLPMVRTSWPPPEADPSICARVVVDRCLQHPRSSGSIAYLPRPVIHEADQSLEVRRSLHQRVVTEVQRSLGAVLQLLESRTPRCWLSLTSGMPRTPSLTGLWPHPENTKLPADAVLTILAHRRSASCVPGYTPPDLPEKIGRAGGYKPRQVVQRAQFRLRRGARSASTMPVSCDPRGCSPQCRVAV